MVWINRVHLASARPRVAQPDRKMKIAKEESLIRSFRRLNNC